MRKLAIFTFATYILILLAPLSFASSGVDITALCAGGMELTDEETQGYVSGTGATYEAVIAKINDYHKEFEKSLIDDDYYKSDYCGLARNNGAYEKGDCSYGTETQFITEISEPIGGAISSESTGGEGQVINVYKGICCWIDGDYQVTTGTGKTAKTETKHYCDSTKVVYFDSYKNCSADAQYCQKIQWLISKTGAGIIKTYVKQIYVYGAGIVGFLAVAVIVGSGIQISLSGASGDITAAKDRIIQSLMGIALLFLSALILYTINPTFFS